MEVHQITQGFAYGDATSNMALTLQQQLLGMGVSSSRIFSRAENIGSDQHDRCLDIGEHVGSASAENVILYHYGNASPLSAYYANAPGRKILVYHNVTPACYFRALAPDTAVRLDAARGELSTLADCTDLCCGISAFNLAGVSECGFRKTMVFPAWIDKDALGVRPSPAILHRYRDGFINLLFVGRVAPNKKIEDLLRLYQCLKKSRPDLRVRLIVAGSTVGMELYKTYLAAKCLEAGLDGVVFTGHVTQADLNAYYRVSHAFLCASEHEGFCIPLMEATFFGLPVFAFDIPGVRETLEGTGVLFLERDFRYAAEIIARVVASSSLTSAVVDGQKTRLLYFSSERVAEHLAEALAAVGAAPDKT
ncbi:MAG: glycosyltransferase [Lentisphaerae bacterium]|nr:glycosyltransferase [Lentisphaerota bacterium]